MSERGPYLQRRRELLRELVLDGARDELLRHSWEEVSMREVAAVAGVHRTSLYTEFGDRQRLLRVLAARELDRAAEEMLGALRASAEAPSRAVADAVRTLLTAVQHNGLLAALVRRDSPAVTRLFAGRRTAVVRRLTDGVQSIWPELGEAVSATVADLLVRYLVSLPFMPSSSPERTAHGLGEVLGAYVEHHMRQPPAAPPRAA